MIIIETPAPPTRERLVLVPLDTVSREAGAELLTIRTANARDATPEDLARAGYVLLVGYLPRREVETAVSDAMDQRQLGEALQRAATAERERGEARADRDAQLVRALDAERDLGATMREVATLRAELARLTAVEGEILDAWQHAGAGVTEAWLYRAGVARERARQARTEPRATDEELFAIADAVYEEAHGGEVLNGLHEIARRVAAHVRRERCSPDEQPAQGRATDGELFAIARAAYDAPDDFGVPWIARIVHAVADRVRAERCLVTRAVAANVDIRVCEDDGGGFLVGVHAPDCDEDLERNVPATDVPATLARLLGEVSRG